MYRAPRFRLTRLLSSALAGGMLLAGCGLAYDSTSEAPASAPMQESLGGVLSNESVPAPAPTDAIAQNAVTESTTSEVPRSQPQLIKTAEMVITVDSVEASLEAITTIARQQQGDLLGLQNQTPQDNTGRHTASAQVRVPQANLDATLAEFAKLGVVQRQSITAQDVSNQLVDFQARLRNLRRAEATVLEIMDRSGDITDVLKVAQELNNIRSSIEQIDAQLSDLQNRVAYSTIALSVEEAITTVPPQRSVQIQLQETWEGATRSIGKVTVDLLQLGIWLLVYSPYLLLVTGAIVFGYIRIRRSNPASPEPQE